MGREEGSHIEIRLRSVDTPVGTLLLGAIGHRLALCVRCPSVVPAAAEEATRRALPHLQLRPVWQTGQSDDSAALLALTEHRLGEYFAGHRRFFNIPLVDPAALGASPFATLVWQVLDAIPYGSTATYGQVARAVSHPEAARAVGHACSLNPVCIVRPCHRVVGADGSLTGYAGGMEMKQTLLRREQSDFF